MFEMTELNYLVNHERRGEGFLKDLQYYNGKEVHCRSVDHWAGSLLPADPNPVYSG